MLRPAVIIIVVASLAMVAVDRASSVPVTPTERSCVVDPIERVALQDAANGPVPRRAAPTISEVAVTDVELNRITRAVRIVTACTNANQPLRALAMVTDRYLAEYFAGPAGQDQLGHLLAVASREPEPAAPEDRLTLVEIADPVRYEDGRIAVTVVTENAATRFTDQLIFVETEDGWRLDQVVLGEQQPNEGTPTGSPTLAIRSFHVSRLVILYDGA